MMNVEEIQDFCLSLGNDVEEKLPFTMFKTASTALSLQIKICGDLNKGGS